MATVLFFVAGLINFVPVSGVLSAARLEGLYGLPFDDASLLILMRHRAVLLGIIGGLMMTSAFYHPLRAVALVAGLVSMLSFLLLAYGAEGYNDALQRVAVADVGACLALLGGAALSHLERRQSAP